MANETTTKFKVDISELKRGISEAQRQIKLANAEFKAASAGMDDWSKSADGCSAKLKQLKTVLSSQKSVLAAYEKQLEAVVAEEGESSKGADNLRIKIANQQAAIASTEAELQSLAKTLAKTNDEATDTANGGFTVLKGALANLVSQGINAALEGIKQLGAAIVDLGKQSVAGYAEFEQLQGGVEKLFGPETAKTVEKNATLAYKTAGLSANKYLETVTNFSASLISGLEGDTAEAAKVADTAIKDMSDNANTFGTDISSIMNAYQGFAKGNFTMLDNLKLGYGGTKEEMARLINESGVLGESFEATAKNLDEVPFDKVILAINETQKRLNIYGTTAKEASSTVEGSVGSMKAAWENFVAGIARGDQNPEELFNTVVEAAEQVWENLKPVLERLIDNAINLVIVEFNKRFPEVFKKLVEIKDAVKGAFDWILKNKNSILAAIGAIAAGMAAFNIANTIMNLVKAFKAWKAATEGVSIAQQLLNTIMAANPIGLVIAAVTALVAGFTILWNTSEEFRQFWIDLWEGIKAAAQTVVEAISGFFSTAWDAVKKVWNGAKSFFTGIWDGIKGIFGGVKDWFSSVFQGAADAISTIFNGIVGVIKAPINFLINALNKVIDGINNIKIPSWVPGIGGYGINIPKIPNLAKGGVLKKGQLGLLEGNGAEAVVPLENNKRWIAATAKELKGALQGEQIISNNAVGNQTYNFYQTNNSPKALSRLDIYRQTRNQIALLKGGPLNA